MRRRNGHAFGAYTEDAAWKGAELWSWAPVTGAMTSLRTFSPAVLATGYKNQQDVVPAYLGDEVADRVGPV